MLSLLSGRTHTVQIMALILCWQISVWKESCGTQTYNLGYSALPLTTNSKIPPYSSAMHLMIQEIDFKLLDRYQAYSGATASTAEQSKVDQAACLQVAHLASWSTHSPRQYLEVRTSLREIGISDSWRRWRVSDDEVELYYTHCITYVLGWDRRNSFSDVSVCVCVWERERERERERESER